MAATSAGMTEKVRSVSAKRIALNDFNDRRIALR
jgi:hypothetical protein